MLSIRTTSDGDSPLLTELRRWAEELVRSRSEVLGVLLLGPRLGGGEIAPGRHDMIVLVEASTVHPWQRARSLPPLPVGLRHDKVVYTRQEFRRLREAGNHFIRRALAEGRWLAREEARSAAPPPRNAPEAPGSVD